MHADTLITDARVMRSDGTTATVDIAISDGKIASVAGPQRDTTATNVIAAEGSMVTPGIFDTHNHLLLGFDPDAVSLEGAADLDEVRDRISAHAKARPELDWVCAENAVYSIVDGRRPSAHDLAGVADRPVFVTTYDQHSVWLNEHAITLLGLDTGGDLRWGRVERDHAGNATGWVTDFYTSAMTGPGLEQLQRDIPLYSEERRYRKVVQSLEMAARFGLTSVMEPQVPLAELQLLQRAEREGHVRSRVTVGLDHPAGAGGEYRKELAAAKRDFAANGSTLDLGYVKLYADDVIEPHTAAMLADYANRPGERGRLSWAPEAYAGAIAELDRLGFVTHTHATGDWGIRMALDGIQHAQRTNGTVDRRHAIVHVEYLHPDDLPRFAELGVVPVMQPRHCSPDLVSGAWMDNVGEENWDRAWQMRGLMDSGAAVSFSSDWQVGEMDPLVGLYTAQTRASLDGTTSWVPQERVSFAQALRAYTQGGAHAMHQDASRGSLRKGQDADLVLWSADLSALEPQALLEQRVEQTIVGGRTVFHAETGLC